jgi:diguanylate cyclase (GGDEF)-like protein
MHTQPSKTSRVIRKEAQNSMLNKKSSPPRNTSAEPEAPRALFCEPPQLALRQEKAPADVAFENLLSDANNELAKLLQDVRKEALNGIPGNNLKAPASNLLMRAVRCAAKQYMLQAHLGGLALTDELTGLYNRRGFEALAERQLKLERRSGGGLLLFFIDVDGLKAINDTYGHSTGDHVLKRTAEALKKTFRDSDILARLGGDEFAVLAVEASDDCEATMRARLQEYLNALNRHNQQYRISLSAGAARFDRRCGGSLGDLMARADRAMYEQKRNRMRPQVLGAAGSSC